MSTSAVRWALYHAPCDDPHDLVVLTALADHASGADGNLNNIATATIAKKLGIPQSDANVSIRRLRKAGLVELGDRGKIARIAVDRNRDGKR